jgi:hypothetical protein
MEGAMIIEWLTIDGVDYTAVEVAVAELVHTDVFGADADEQHTTATHVGFADLGGGEMRQLYGTRQPSGTIAWEAA